MDTAETIHKALREEYAEYVALPDCIGATPNARQHAGYCLTRPQPMAAWSREAPDDVLGNWWSDVRDWILRATGKPDQIVNPNRTQWETDAILRASVRDKCRCGTLLSAHEKTTADGDCFGCRAARRKGGAR